MDIRNKYSIYIKSNNFKLAKIALIVFLFLGCSHFLQAQSEKEKISISQLIELLQAEKEEINISDVEIFYTKEDAHLSENKIAYRIFTISPKYKGSQKIYFHNCDFNTGTKVRFIFKDWDFKKFHLTECVINTFLTFNNCKQTGDFRILFANNKFNYNFEIKDSDSLSKIEFENCSFYKKLALKTNLKKLTINNCNFVTDTLSSIDNIEGNISYQMSIHDQIADDITIKGCRFENNGIYGAFSIDFSGSEFDKLVLMSNTLNTLNFSDTKVDKAILIDSLFVSDYIGVQNFDFPESNTNIPWYNFGNEKLALIEASESQPVKIYQAKTREQLLNTLSYNDLISAYNKLNKIYHERGDIQSANNSYVEIKKLETRRQKYLLDTSWDFNVYINYKLNVFLSFFSDYATNPGKSLIQSLWILLIFSFFYMFSFSDWDGMNYQYYLAQYKLFARYIKKNKNVDDVYAYAVNPHQDIMKEIKEKYIDAGKNIPRSLRLFGKPMHFLGKFRYAIIPNLIRLFDFQPKAWSSLNNGEKIYSGILIILILFTYVVYVLTVKFINAFILSLNSFVVIGYGLLPEKGLAMYLSIIEGIIGWFLLTIFTITLLSQVLQNV